jgi:hypothetical protein
MIISLFPGKGRKSIILLDGSQALPVRPSDKGSVNVKVLGWLEAVAWDRGNLIFCINFELYNLVFLAAVGLNLRASKWRLRINFVPQRNKLLCRNDALSPVNICSWTLRETASEISAFYFLNQRLLRHGCGHAHCIHLHGWMMSKLSVI